MPFVLKSGSLNLLEPSGPVQACNGTALHFDIRVHSAGLADKKIQRQNVKYKIYRTMILRL